MLPRREKGKQNREEEEADGADERGKSNKWKEKHGRRDNGEARARDENERKLKQ